MATLYMLVGIPGSGKTTFCLQELIHKYPNAKIIASDIVRNENPTLKEEEIWPEIYRLCATSLNDNHDIIYDATNITPKVRNRFFEQLALRNCVNYEKVAYYFITEPKVCMERVSIRNLDENERFLPIEVIESYGSKIIAPSKEEGFKEIIIIDNNKNKLQ